MTIRKSKELSGVLGDDVKTRNILLIVHYHSFSDASSPVMGGLGLSSSLYHLLPVDLREPPETSLSTIIQSRAENTTPILQANVPTLFLAECVLVYMTLEESSAVLQWFSSHFQVQFVFDMAELRPMCLIDNCRGHLRDVLPG